MGSDRPRSPEKSNRKPAKEREITPSDDTKAVSTQNSPVFRGVHQFTAEGVRDGRLALERALSFAPDLVIMDIQLPHVSGIDLIEAMQKEAALSAIPVLAVTAYAGKGDEDLIMAAGAKGYLV